MKQSTEDRIITYVTAHPDQTSVEIAKGLKLSTGTVKPQLKALAIACKISRVPVKSASGIGRLEFRYFEPVAKKVEEKPKAQTPPILTAPVVTKKTGLWPVLKPEVAQDPPTKHSDLDQTISDFAALIAKSVAAQALQLIIPKLRDEMVKVVAEAANSVAAPVAVQVHKPEPKKLPSIFIGGLQPSATSPLAKEFDGVADLRFVTPEDHANVWKSKSAHADHAIIMAGFVGHKHVEAVQSTGIKPTLMHGGMTHLKDKIMELALK